MSNHLFLFDHANRSKPVFDQSKTRFVNWKLSQENQNRVPPGCTDCLGTIDYGTSSGAAINNAFIFFPTFPTYTWYENGTCIKHQPDYYTNDPNDQDKLKELQIAHKNPCPTY